MPEVAVRKLIDYGIKRLRKNKPAFDDLFSMFVSEELSGDYGEAYREKIWKWFSETKIPVIQAWSFNSQKIPCVSVHLANETEDESKAAINDFAGLFTEDQETGTGVFTTMVDIGIHANRGGDHVLWMYYIVSYILFKYKAFATNLGLTLHTYSASDYSKDAAHMAENTWTRWIRFKCTTQNFWGADETISIEDINTEATIEDGFYNAGIIASKAGDDEGEEDFNI